MKKFEITSTIQLARDRFNTLEKALPDVMRPSRWWERRFTMADRIAFLTAFADSRSQMWNLVYDTYPEVKGRSVSMVGGYIECASLGEPESVAAVDPVAGSHPPGPRA